MIALRTFSDPPFRMAEKAVPARWPNVPVSKFVTTAMLLREQTGRDADGLHGWLFDSPTLAAELGEDERERYRRANRYAAKYCRRLLQRTRGSDDDSAAQRELRHFYRLSQGFKLAHIDAR